MAANPFDQFDAPTPPASIQPATSANPFNQFDDQQPYTAELFKQRVGRAPNDAELANFQQMKGAGWAGDPNIGTAGQQATALAKAAGGLAETGMHFASGAIAPFGGGLTYLGTLALTRGDTDAARAVQQATEGALTYDPRSDAGQTLVGGVNQAAQKTIGRATDFLSDKAADIGGPVAGAATRTAIEGAPYILGGGSVMRAARGAVDAAASAASAEARSATAVTTEGAKSAAALEGGGAAPRSAAPATPAPSDVVGASAAAPPKFETPPPASQAGAAEPAPLSTAEQAARADTLQRIGLTDVRESAITGDKPAAATDYQQSKVDGPAGKPLKDSFDAERAALDNASDKLVAGADGTGGLDETSLHNRGATILAPFEQLSDSYDAQIRGLYQKADATAQGMPVDLKSTAATLGNRPAFIATTDGQQLLRGVNAYMRQAGLIDDAGQFQGATVAQAERLRQYLGDAWSPRTAKVIRAVRDAIDDDVAQAAGSDVYGQARALRAARAATLDDPKGVASLLDSSGPNGINRAVPIERIPDQVARMPVDQFGHVVKTLQSMPAEMQPAAKAALGEIRSQMMLRMQEQAQKLKGAWNNRGVSQYLNANASKLAQVFSPAELENMHTLNRAGHILDVDRTYPGAAVQGHNLAVRGALGAIEHGATALGAHAFGPVGAIGGEIAGAAAAKAVGGGLSARAARSRIRKL